MLLTACSKYEKRVDAFYYPDRINLSQFIEMLNVDSVEACRDWAYAQASKNGDAYMSVGDYECGVNLMKDSSRYGGLRVYEKTVK